MNRFGEIIGDDRFASGYTTYTDHYGGEVQNTRIVLPLYVGTLLVSAVVDTATPWCILNPAIVEQMSPNSMERVGEDRQNIRGIKYEGDLIRTNIKLHADYGEDLVIDATIFVPILKFDEVWNLPNFLGLDGFLHRLRFAVDPQSNTFYFGMIAD